MQTAPCSVAPFRLQSPSLAPLAQPLALPVLSPVLNAPAAAALPASRVIQVQAAVPAPRVEAADSAKAVLYGLGKAVDQASGKEPGPAFRGAFDGAGGVRSSLPESQAWTLPDSGPLMRQTLAGKEYAGRRYTDFLNATALRVEGREFIWVRAIREGYKTHVSPAGEVANEGYYSDTLLFEVQPEGGIRFIERTLASDPASGVLLEDARASSFRMRGRDPKTGRFRVEEVALLGFTHHARHGGMEERTSRNAFVRLRTGEDGVPRPERDAAGGLKLHFLSPEPILHRFFVDAKNGIILPNSRGDLRMHARHRYQADDPRLPEGFRPSDYAEQSFPLGADFLGKEPDWTALMSRSSEHEVLRAEGLKEHYPKESLWPGSGKGHGPGAQPVRIQRRGTRLYVSEGWGHAWIYAGEVPKQVRRLLSNRKTRFVSFDHEIRFLKVRGKRKRVYTLSVKLWGQDLDRILAYRADMVQPKGEYETSNPGVPDLWHVYPTGRVVRGDGSVDTYEGAADANVMRRRWDLPRLLSEMAVSPE